MNLLKAVFTLAIIINLSGCINNNDNKINELNTKSENIPSSSNIKQNDDSNSSITEPSKTTMLTADDVESAFIYAKQYYEELNKLGIKGKIDITTLKRIPLENVLTYVPSLQKEFLIAFEIYDANAKRQMILTKEKDGEWQIKNEGY